MNVHVNREMFVITLLSCHPSLHRQKHIVVIYNFQVTLEEVQTSSTPFPLATNIHNLEIDPLSILEILSLQVVSKAFVISRLVTSDNYGPSSKPVSLFQYAKSIHQV